MPDQYAPGCACARLPCPARLTLAQAVTTQPTAAGTSASPRRITVMCTTSARAASSTVRPAGPHQEANSAECQPPSLLTATPRSTRSRARIVAASVASSAWCPASRALTSGVGNIPLAAIVPGAKAASSSPSVASVIRVSALPPSFQPQGPAQQSLPRRVEPDRAGQQRRHRVDDRHRDAG